MKKEERKRLLKRFSTIGLAAIIAAQSTIMPIAASELTDDVLQEEEQIVEDVLYNESDPDAIVSEAGDNSLDEFEHNNFEDGSENNDLADTDTLADSEDLLEEVEEPEGLDENSELTQDETYTDIDEIEENHIEDADSENDSAETAEEVIEEITEEITEEAPYEAVVNEPMMVGLDSGTDRNTTPIYLDTDTNVEINEVSCQ